LDVEILSPDKPYFAEVELRTDGKDTRGLKGVGYDPNAVAVWTGDFKLVSRNGNFQLYETRVDNQFPKGMKETDESIMFDYLAGLIEAFQETELDLTSGDVTEDQLKELQGLGYTQ